MAVVSVIGALPANAGVRRQGGELIVNSYTTGDQAGGSVVSLLDGGYVIFWSSGFFRGNQFLVLGQRYDRSGTPIGGEFPINRRPDPGGCGESNSLAARINDDTGLVVVWDSCADDGQYNGVFGHRLSPTAEPLGEPFQINTYTSFYQDSADVAASDDGFVVIWADSGEREYGFSNVFGRRYSEDAEPLGEPFQIPTTTAGRPLSPRVSGAKDGSFVVVWYALQEDGSDDAAVARLYSPAGTPASAPFVVNTYTTNPQREVDVAVGRDGSFVVVWVSGQQDGDLTGIFGQRFDSAGTRVGDEFAVNTYTTGNQRFPSIVQRPLGGFVVTWTSHGQDGDGNGVFARVFDDSGVPDGKEFQVNLATTGDQNASRAAAFIADDQLVVAWTDRASRDGFSAAVVTQRFIVDDELGPVCGDARKNDLVVTTVDALAVLQSGVGIVPCDACICDLNGNGSVQATDALLALRVALSLPAAPACPPCEENLLGRGAKLKVAELVHNPG